MSEAKNLPARRSSVAFTYNGLDVLRDGDRLVSLNQMWEAAGKPENKDPRRWADTEQGRSFIADLARNLNVVKNGIWKSKRGKHKGGTWAHWQVAMAYAKYLSHEFHRFVNEAFREWAEEQSNPGLKAERAIDGFRRRGLGDAWIGERLDGILVRKSLTGTMQDHNCKPVGKDNPFAEATRSISLQVLGKTPREIKASKGLAKSARTRDHLDKYELTRLRFAESEAERLIKTEGSDGNAECVDACRRAGRAVRVAIDSLNKTA